MPNFDIGTISSPPNTLLFATAADMLERFDIDRIKRLVTDDRVEISTADLVVHSSLTTAIRSASGRIEAAMLHGARYSREELLGLSDNSKAWLADLTCDLAMLFLIRRRGKNQDEREAIEKSTDSRIDRLSSGKDVFNLRPQVEAGLLSVEKIESWEMVNRGLISDHLNGHLFPDYPDY